ncbi:MAG TPA: ATP-binding protein, partial [Gemmatimonadales bacterium]|nr:ATP-binding protein [Gemmatimonadales bacterium]
PVWVSGMLLDVTAQREATARLRAEERRYHDIFEATGTAIWESDYTAVADELDALQARGVTDVRAHLEAHPEELGRIMAGRRVLDVNPAALRMHGARSKRELLEGMSRLRTPSAREMMIRTLEALARGETRLDFDMTAGTLDGGSVDTLASVSISPRGERPVRVLLSLHDVTPLKRAETVLLEANQRKDEFLAMLAHELRNPLAPIRNAAEALQLVRTEEPVVAWARDVIERQVAHLAHIVDDLLDISRIMQGKATLRRQPVDLRAVARSAVETSRPVIDARGHAFIVRLPPKPVVVDGDFVRLAQVIANLLNNAGKYTPPEGRISLDVEAVEGEAQVRVVDSGEGMAPELLTQVFDLFTQAHRTLDRAQGGLGIGLTVVKRLVELHGGTVVASSEGPGRGSTFTLRLPLCDALPQAPESPRAEARRPAASALRVLVVDDSRDAAESLAELLRLSGHEVRTAEDALAALAVTREFRPDVGLLDLGLPGLDGFELAGRLRS